jgi:hypothetical protein
LFVVLDGPSDEADAYSTLDVLTFTGSKKIAVYII